MSGMGTRPVAQARPSVMFPKGSAAYWELRDQQERQIFEEDDTSSAEGGCTPEAASSRKVALRTPASGQPRKSLRLKDRDTWASEGFAKLAHRQMEELAEKDRCLDEAGLANRTTSEKLVRLQEEHAELKRQYVLQTASKDRELKALDGELAQKEDAIQMEMRRRMCVTDELESLRRQLQEEADKVFTAYKKLSLANEQAEEFKAERQALEAEKDGNVAVITRLRKQVGSLELELEASEAKRLGIMTQQYQADSLSGELKAAKQQAAAADAKAAALQEENELLLNLKREHEAAIKRLAAAHDVDAKKAAGDAEALRHKVAVLEKELETPREDHTVRGQVDELRRENSRVREEKRTLQTQLNKANTDLRRLSRKNESLAKQLAEAEEESEKTADLRKRLDGLLAEQGSEHGGDKASPQSLRDELEAAKQRGDEKRRLARAHAEAEARLATADVTISTQAAEIETLTATVRSLRSDAETQLEAQCRTSTAREKEDLDRTSSSTMEADALRSSFAEGTKRVMEELRESQKLFAEVFGFKVAKGRGAAAYRVAAINPKGHAQWKNELCVRKLTEREKADFPKHCVVSSFAAAPSPLLTSYLERFASEGAVDEPIAPALILARCAADIVLK
ncbi:hypothetical protein DIPPA_30775 [Diplonema papillatum]|nr:hypothetical protein DIPPA_30775 [Diplonema papillatum]